MEILSYKSTKIKSMNLKKFHNKSEQQRTMISNRVLWQGLIVFLCLLCCHGNEEEITTIETRMPLVETDRTGEYVCFARKIDEIDKAYLESLTIIVDHGYVHHVSTGLCEAPASDIPLWKCSKTHITGKNCIGSAVNFVGWDDLIKTFDSFKPPKGLTIPVGKDTPHKYLLVEVHFSDIVKNPSMNAANVSLTLKQTPEEKYYQSYLLLNAGYIPANKSEGYFTEIGCPWSHPTVYAHRYYLHTHHHGVLVEGYIVRNKTWTLIGSQLSKGQPKETYEISGGPLKIQKGDVLTARCFYINDSPNPINFDMKSEMCNFNIEFGYDPKDEAHYRRPLGCQTNSPEFSFCDHKQTDGVCK